ncbi:MAG TPA: hypothetical protein PLV92_23695, partial [Pirellulaceae bacterium]|nr:hypothetical protein [Pirellulaceae bacterium]
MGANASSCLPVRGRIAPPRLPAAAFRGILPNPLCAANFHAQRLSEFTRDARPFDRPHVLGGRNLI